MKNIKLLFVWRLGCLICAPLLIALGLSGCAEIRKITYPKDFVWLEKSEVQTVMHRFSASMQRIEAVTQFQNPDNNELIIDEIDKMIREAETLMARRQSGDSALLRTNHLLLDNHIDDFLSDLLETKLSIQNQPDNYYLAGKLTGNCLGCHQYR